MKNLIIKIGAVFLASTVIYIGIIIVLVSIGQINRLPNVKYTLGGNGYTLLRLQEAEKAKNLDILFVGSSHVYRSFDTRIFEQYGYKTFNLGTSAQTPFVSYFLLREFIPDMRPKYIVMDLYWLGLQKAGVESGVDIISNSEINSNLIDMAAESRDVLLYNSILVSGTRQLFKPISKEDQKKYKTDKYIPNGFVESLRTKNMLNQAKLASLKKHNFEPDVIQFEYVEKIINLCKHHNVKLTFVITPVTKEYLASVRNYSEYKHLVESLSVKNSILLLDYNMRNELSLNSEVDFYDKNHLNQSGVVKFNNLFITDFTKHTKTKVAVN